MVGRTYLGVLCPLGNGHVQEWDKSFCSDSALGMEGVAPHVTHSFLLGECGICLCGQELEAIFHRPAECNMIAIGIGVCGYGLMFKCT